MLFCGLGSLEGSKLLPSMYNEQALKLKNHYYAIEVHPTMSIAEKIPYMVEWLGQKLLICFQNQ